MRTPIVIAPEGELDVTAVPDFRAALADAAHRATHGLIVDLSNVSFIDSSALGALVDVHTRLRRDTKQLAVVVPDGSAVAVVLTLTGLRERLSVFGTRDAALGS